MASPDVIAAALVLPVPLIALALAPFHPAKPALVLLAALSAVAASTTLAVACGAPLALVAKVFTSILHTALSGISIYALSPSCQLPALPPPFLEFFLSLAALLVVCELITTLVPPSPPLLYAGLALVSRLILLAIAIASALLRRRPVPSGPDIEKRVSSDRSPARVPSPTQATWPFPASLAVQTSSESGSSSSHPLTPPDLTPEPAYVLDRYLPLAIVIAQIFSSLSASLSVAVCMLVNSPITLSRVHIASAACALLWSLTVLVVIHLLPSKSRPCSPGKQVVMGYEHAPLGGDRDRSLRDHHGTRTPKPALSRRESDSLLDFLSLRDPFASSPPPPPPLPPVGLGLEEVDVGWNGSREIGMQYRFPAPRSIVKGTRRKTKKDQTGGNKRLAHQDSARALLPVPETRGAEADADRDKDKGFGDEARLAELLLQSLGEGGDHADGPKTATLPTPTVQLPQTAHVPQTSRWSTSTTVQSIMSGSVSNKSGVSTYTTCASDKVPPTSTGRISMNTIASVLGSRRSAEAKRRSVMTASSSKG